MSERPFEWKRDGGGLALFVVGAFVSVLMVKSLLSDQPPEQSSGTAAIAALFAGSFGAFPCLVLAAGIGFLGARSFVTATEAGALRHALGLVGIALGLSILCGAFSDSGGGKFGLLTGGAFGVATHATLGGLLGLVTLLGSAWFAWLREPGALYEEQIRSTVAEHTPFSDPGVTAAEAAGLIPEEMPQSVPAARKSSHYIPLAAPSSPYPEDVRLKGQVPQGARPIATQNAASAVPSPLLQQPVEPLVERVQPFDPGAPVAPGARAATSAAAPAAREVRPLPPGVRAIAPAAEELTEPGEDRVPVDEAEAQSAVERPSWERTGLGEDDEPVDAYGTPLSLIESLRRAQEELVALPADEPLLETAPAAELAPAELEEAVLAESEEFAAEVEEEEELVEIVEELVPASELEPPVADAQALAQTTIFDFTGEEPAGVELFPEGVPEPPLEAPVEAPPVAELEEETEGDIELDIGEEPEVMLQPQAAPAERTHKSLSVDPERAKLLVQAGNLFVDRGRVAVSMLQREYGMDFDAACKVLDELQDLGLIGPYLGGQRRDILLTRDQWMEKAGAG